MHFPITETHGSVYYEFHRGARDEKQTKENRERSLLYRDRLRSHNHDLGKDNDPDLHRYSVKKKAYKAHHGVRQQYQDSMKQLSLNKSSVERQNVDVTVQPGIDRKTTSKRNLLPSYRSHKRPDNRALFHSLKRSYVRLTEGSSLEKDNSGLNLRDISPEERTAMHRE